MEGVDAVRFGIPKWNGFAMALEAFRSFRYNLLGEQGGERGLVFAPSLLGSEMGIGRRASAAAPFRCGLALRGGAARQDWRMSNRDRARRNLGDFHSYCPSPSVRAKPPD